MPIIILPDGTHFDYKIRPLYLGVKKINKKQAKENLLLLKSIADKSGLCFALAFGTALGAVREHDFIEHDEDIDLWVHYSQKDLLLSLLFELRENGFEVARWDRRGLLSIIRKNEYIDFYIYYPDSRAENIMSCCGDPMPQKYIENWTEIPFLGKAFYIAREWEEMMLFRYGKDWRTPVAETDFKVSRVRKSFYYIKDVIKGYLPDLIYFLIYRRLDEQKLLRYYSRLERFNTLKGQ